MSTDLSDTGFADDVLAVVLAGSGASEPEVGNSLTSRFAALRPRLWLQEIFGESCPFSVLPLIELAHILAFVVDLYEPLPTFSRSLSPC